MEGMACTHLPWLNLPWSLAVSPIELLFPIAVGSLVVATVVCAASAGLACLRHVQVTWPAWRLQVAGWVLLALCFFSGFEPRLAGLALRGRIKQRELLDFADQFRNGGCQAVRDHEISRWRSGDLPFLRSTPQCVEVFWDSECPKPWSFRIEYQNRSEALSGTSPACKAMAASDRITALIGLDY